MSEFIKFLSKANKEVEQWPKWKRDALSDLAPSSDIEPEPQNARPIEDELRAEIVDLKEKLEAYSAVGTSLMRADLDSIKRIAALEQWQREACTYLRGFRQLMPTLQSDEFTLNKLIKQAEGK